MTLAALENTQCSMKIKPKSSFKPRSYLKSAEVAANRLINYVEPEGFDPSRKAPEVYEDFDEDANKVVASIASRYVDPTCPMLTYEDLVQQGNYKISMLLTDSWPMKCTTRVEFFRVLKTSVNNHIKGVMQRHRLTVKRTGIKPPKKGELRDGPTKPVEISLDDPESHMQIGEEFDTGEVDKNELYHDIVARLTPLEKLVLDQMYQPNTHALMLAELDSATGGRGSYRVSVQDRNLAAGLGISLDQFQRCQKRIRDATHEAMHNDDSISYAAVIGALESVFSVKVPDLMKSASCNDAYKLQMRRMFTLAARHQPDKVTDDVASMLLSVGAKVPERLSGEASRLSCYGVLYKSSHEACQACQLASACRGESQTIGIDDEFNIDLSLMGSKALQRTPTIVDGAGSALRSPEQDSAPDSQESDPRHRELMDYLETHFRKCVSKGDSYFCHRERGNGKGYPFRMRKVGQRYELLFCRADKTDGLVDKLEKVDRTYRLPSSLTVAQAIQLIDEHARSTF